jgi:RNA polymerase sigma-70 factor, ECF subfamily
MDATLLTIQDEFGHQLQRIICKKVRHQDICHDIMQDVYLKIITNLPKIQQATNTAAYLVQLTNNTVTDHFRKKTKGVLVNEDGPALGIEPEEQKDQSLQLADCCLRPMIDSLPAIYSEALILTELEGMKHKDYAEKAGISLTNAKTRVQRAKEKLKEVIMHCCNYEFDAYGNIVGSYPNKQTNCL